MVGRVKHDFGLVNEGCGSVSSGCVGFGLFGLFGGFGVLFVGGLVAVLDTPEGVLSLSPQ